MLAKLILSASYIILMAGALWALRPFRNASPFFWFIIAQGMMAVGTFAIIDTGSNAHIVYALLFHLALVVFVLSSFLYIHRSNLIADLKHFSKSEATEDSRNAKLLTCIMFLFCVAVTVVYYNSIGYNILASLLLGEGVNDYSTMRITSYSGSANEGADYFAPGYVNQFKNVLLPITAVAISIWLKRSGNKVLFYGFSLLALIVTILALAGTGQRGYLFYTSAALFFSFVLYSLGKRGLGLTQIAFLAAPVAVLFMFMTAAYYESADQGVWIALRDTAKRFTSIQQDSGLAGFEYVFGLEPQWFSDWLKAVTGILPGFEGSMVAHEVHAIMYGSYRGTAPLSSIGSAYYNGRAIGVMLLFVFMGFFYAQAYRSYLRGPRTVLRSICYGFIFFYLTVYLVDTPVTLVDNGVLAVAIFLWLAQFVSSRQGAPRTQMQLATHQRAR